jgi:hypothetical protein
MFTPSQNWDVLGNDYSVKISINCKGINGRKPEKGSLRRKIIAQYLLEIRCFC